MRDYNELFAEYEDNCRALNKTNIFSCITANELDKLADLLDTLVG